VELADGDSSLYWGRANGWVTSAGYDYLRALVIREQSDAVAEAALAEQVAGIIASQDPSGLWWIILNHPDEIYLETSTTALLAYGLARGYRYGLLDGEVVLPVIESSVAALETKIVPDGDGLPVVTEISGPTGPGELADYAAVPLEDDISYGVGAVILALIESSGLPPA
jgi:unsaturated rhamnogalacturonyl hydrolase